MQTKVYQQFTSNDVLTIIITININRLFYRMAIVLTLPAIFLYYFASKWKIKFCYWCQNISQQYYFGR